MKNTPSALKWLAEKRGRLAHDLAVTRRIAEDINRRLAVMQLDLDALDRALTIYDPAIAPANIEPVNGWKGRYGQRGALRSTMEAALKAQAPAWTSTDTLELLVLTELRLGFETPFERRRWYDNSFKAQLKVLARAGVIERMHDPEEFTSETGHWRWKVEEVATLAGLAGRGSA